MDFYVILGVDRDASLVDVKRAYRRLARRYHPDINPGDREAAALYRRATEAYETLSDAARRLAYDTHGPSTPTVTGETVEFHGFDFTTPVTGTSVTFGELFLDDARASDSTPSAAPERGSDLFGELELSFEEALRGVERKLMVTRLESCGSCGGRGLRRARETSCVDCQGEGAVRWRRGHMVFSKRCRRCAGTGRLREQPCSACHADGVVTMNGEIAIQVPAGVADGARMKVPGKGNAGRHGGPPGDLLITAKVDKHRLFERDGDDLLLHVPIGVHEAALGAVIDVPTPDGPARLRIPPQTRSGERLRLRHRGAPSPRTGQRGDLLITVTLVLPEVADERSRELLRELGRRHGADLRRDLFGD